MTDMTSSVFLVIFKIGDEKFLNVSKDDFFDEMFFFGQESDRDSRKRCLFFLLWKLFLSYFALFVGYLSRFPF